MTQYQEIGKITEELHRNNYDISNRRLRFILFFSYLNEAEVSSIINAINGKNFRQYP